MIERLLTRISGGGRDERVLARGFFFLLVLAQSVLVSGLVRAQEPFAGQALFRQGKYQECAAMARGRIAAGGALEWHRLLIESELVCGRYAEALVALDQAVESFSRNVPLRLLAWRVHREAGRDQEAAADLEMIEQLILRAGGQFTAPEDRLALGRYFLIKGADPRTVLERFYDPVLREHPNLLEAYYASAELALEKDDFGLAAATLLKAPAESAGDPYYHTLLARAYEHDDPAVSARAIAAALKLNPRHVDSLLLEADRRIDAERYEEAGDTLDQVLAVHPREPRALAFKAALALLRNKEAEAATLRAQALSVRSTNPEVDHLIGRILASKYRFQEAATRLRQALEIDPQYIPAQLELCQALLRLGQESEGWDLAARILARDPYNVVAFNLVSLRDHLARFRTIEADGVMLRMNPLEADLYGARALELLRKARTTLCARYEVELKEPILVEIFPDRKDFAVRTFGLPGADGFLGVCFGKVVTANSPRSGGEHPANLEAVLWHEFCHVVTLAKSRNRIPRWLSEGISVHEEARANHAWATALNPTYRKLILGPELTPLSKLSSAFLNAKTPLHLQFAYFQSGLAVDFLEKQFGLGLLKDLLDDLGHGLTLEESLPGRAGMTLNEIDRRFGDFARRRARETAAGASWDEPNLPSHANAAAIRAWLAQHRRSFPGTKRLAAQLVAEKIWEEARTVLDALKALDPEDTTADNAYWLLAMVHRARGDTAAEARELEELAQRDGDAIPAYTRLMELKAAAGDWAAVALNARRMLAVNPLIPLPHRMLAEAAERQGLLDEAVAAARSLALLDQVEPAEAHFRLARLLAKSGQVVEARRETLKALEEAPRFLKAFRLLLDLGPSPDLSAVPPSPRPAPTEKRAGQ